MARAKSGLRAVIIRRGRLVEFSGDLHHDQTELQQLFAVVNPLQNPLPIRQLHRQSRDGKQAIEASIDDEYMIGTKSKSGPHYGGFRLRFRESPT